MSKTKLRDPDITNVDLVNKPANPGARVMLFKADTAEEPKKGSLLHLIAKKLGLTDRDIEEVEKDDPTQALVDKVAEEKEAKGDEVKMADLDKTKLSKEAQEYITKLEGDIDTLRKSATPEVKPDDVLKNVDPVVKKLVDDLTARTNVAEAAVKKVLDETKNKEYIAKAASYDHLGIKADEFGLVLKAIAETSPEAIEKLEAVLKAANESVSKGTLFSEVGSSRTGGTAPAGEEPMGKIREGAKNYIAKLGTQISSEQAIAKFLDTDEGKALYDEYMKEKEGK